MTDFGLFRSSELSARDALRPSLLLARLQLLS